ncbi:hypothetical protein [Paraburkholderia atlantica]|uniref:hypothetical protein n=1 Tax=Paraburkholderia atlantica TaxID=2654982 RepID=UPI00161423E4|nr:hypothetical protein [Paraburkholderia atlantica]MBB5509579.1 hypothetical protein [Paraburkholderia atlantica]
MKLCKDCKHAVLPHPLQMLYGQGYVQAMCGHPEAKRSVVDGSLEVSCVMARGDGAMGATSLSVCGRDAKLFEQAPPPEPQPELNSYAVVPMPVERDSRPFWRRLFG